MIPHDVSAGQASPLDISLQIAAAAQEVDVSAGGTGQVSMNPSSNAGALVQKNEDLLRCPKSSPTRRVRNCEGDFLPPWTAAGPGSSG
jgi:hypothetical protein